MWWLVSMACACSPAVPAVVSPVVDAGAMDAGARVDAGEEPDAGPPVIDAGTPEDAGAPPPSPCTLENERLSCAHTTFELDVAQPIPLRRVVHVGLPRGTPGPRGWPVVILFQGSLFSAQLTWSARRNDPLGAFFQTSTVQALLDAGFAVVTPEVRLFGTTYWDTNVPQWALAWNFSPDHHFMLALLGAIDADTFGPLDGQRLFAGGISSGGYMTSRMALSYPGRFRALAVHSASWATCAGPLCVLPGQLPVDHPPTLFLHGEQDLVVPIGTMRRYDEALRANGVSTKVVVDPSVGHAFLPAAATELRDFFLSR